ncbi:hypothetical protein G6F47_006922 [Rhizopus delemar]|uniref:Ricin B lectin domain-containing protein n=2 Tax=Rhizopus TaxID=4842 RepID=I1CHJ3_RHIO9|nr:hypothetical protein RO3G_12634 [Rhizopus delemar RA 99-880]KAG1540491.1 hypothetical protein G6F51_008490 [Rhizopus arrhizus]KAG1597881.1 hypothetical protein G6F47_006922 [Rhizopus delemar]KAG1632738.1 hypothetical protein G6F45_003900 [Rhizopus arrhizus]KAG1646503.1 hypothetical protein G6F44_000772 [Rhizopus delemar]|eukprot:EIE87923.1 hypothetical protein RO3G_12634 [Rhizopus delemar RA 99-880]
MTVTEMNSFPLGYFYIVSKMHGLVIDIRDSENATVDSKIVMNSKKLLSPERDSQLWIHQDGILTNKLTGLVLDIKRAESFIAIFTRESRLYLDHIKEQETDQRFGHESETGYIFALSDPEVVLDIRHEDTNKDVRVMVYHKKPIQKASNQLWTIEPADPPKPIDSDDENEDDGKRARLKAWFGNWKGWGHKRHQVLAEADLEEANKKVYKEKKVNARQVLFICLINISSQLYFIFSLELIAAAVAFEAVNMWEKKQKEEGKDIHHPTAKKLIAAFVVAELVKQIQERNTEMDTDEDDHKKEMMTNMAIKAATNLFESKHGF